MFLDLVVQYKDDELVTSLPPVVTVIFSLNKFTSNNITAAKTAKKTTKMVIFLVLFFFLLSTSSMIFYLPRLYNIYDYVFDINIWCSPKGAHHCLS